MRGKRPPKPPPLEGAVDLFGWAVTPAERKFAEFDQANPQIWAMFLRFAEDRIARGFKHYSARDIVARMRWETAVAEDTYGQGDGQSDGFKINNNWSSFFARKWRALRIHPELPEFFEFRKARKADEEMKDYGKTVDRQAAGSARSGEEAR